MKITHKAPISSHRLFSVIIAVWFATLLGLGCAVLPAVILERLIGVTGIASIFPAATPPLGMTAHIAISAVAALTGALMGFLIAQRIFNAQTISHTESSDKHAPRTDRAKKIRRPISAWEELGSAALDTPTNDYLTPEPAAVSFPDQALSKSANISDDAELELKTIDLAEPLSFSAPSQEAQEETADDQEDNAAADNDETPEAGAPIRERQGEDHPAKTPVFPASFSSTPLFSSNARLSDGVDAPLEQLGMVELAERLGRSLQNRPNRPKTLPSVFLQALASPKIEQAAPSIEVAVPETEVPTATEIKDVSERKAYSSLLKPSAQDKSNREPGRSNPVNEITATDSPDSSDNSCKSAETEKALRSALAELQRMSGAA